MFTQNSNIGIDIINAVIAFLNDKPIKFIGKDLLESIRFLKPIRNT
jgi:hypothetical protein